MISQDHLKSILYYNPKTGIFKRIVTGTVVGTTDSNGYLTMRVSGKQYKAHRLAWVYMYGVAPTAEIDHINGITSDNRICNLRDVTKSKNQQNRSNVKGYSRDRNRWKAQIRVDDRFVHLGCYETEQEAHMAYTEAKKALHPEARKS